MRYVHPLRLYLVVSIIFFFFLSLSARIEMADSVPVADTEIDTSDSSRVDTAESIMSNRSLTDQQVIDSLTKMGESDLPKNWLERRLFSGGRKMQNSGPNWFVNSFIQNMPIALLLAMPALALLLKLAYYRRKVYYVGHLVHTLHLHAVALLLFSFLIVISLIFSASAGLEDDLLDLPVLLLLLTYIFFSFMRVYQQKWWVTILKLIGIGVVYSIVLSLTIGAIAFIALLDF